MNHKVQTNSVHLVPKRIVFFRTDMLGDTLLNLPVIDELKKRFPQSQLTFVCHPDLAPFLKNHPAIDHVLEYGAGRRKAAFRERVELLKVLRAGQFDLAVISNARKDLHVLTWLAGVKRRIGYRRKWGFFLTDQLRDQKYAQDRHEIEYNLDLLKPLGIADVKTRFSLPLALLDQEGAERMLNRFGIRRKDSFVLAHPFTSDPRKRWTMENFRQLIQKIVKNFQVPVCVIGLASEREQAENLLEGLEGTVYNLAGETKNLNLLCALIQRAVLLIGHDSGPVHLAAGVGTPTATLFAQYEGGPNPRRWGPWGEGHRVIFKPLDLLSPDDVFSAVEEILRRKNTQLVEKDADGSK